MEGLGILLFIIFIVSKVAQGIGKAGPNSRPGNWPGSGMPWPQQGRDWRNWEEDDGELQEEIGDLEGRDRSAFEGRHSFAEDGRPALIREDVPKQSAYEPTTEMVLDKGIDTFSEEELVKGIIFAEILGPPKARRYKH